MFVFTYHKSHILAFVLASLMKTSNSFISFFSSLRHAKNVITCFLMGRLSTTVEPVVAESAGNVQPIRNLFQNEAGVRGLCECVTAALENRQLLRCSLNRLAT